MTEKEKNDEYYYYGYVQEEGEQPQHLILIHNDNYIEDISSSIHNTLVSLPLKDFIPISSAMRKSKYVYIAKEDRYEDISHIYDNEIKSIISSLYKEIDR